MITRSVPISCEEDALCFGYLNIEVGPLRHSRNEPHDLGHIPYPILVPIWDMDKSTSQGHVALKVQRLGTQSDHCGGCQGQFKGLQPCCSKP